MQLITRNILVLSTLMLSFACGGDDDDKGGGSVSSGVAKDKQLSALTQAEADQLGKSFASSLNVPELIEGMCTLTATFAAAFAPMDGSMPAQSCEMLTQQCVDGAKSNPATVTSSNAPALPTTTAGYMGCNATVGELETCLGASVKVMSAAFGSIKCGQDLSMLNITPTTEIEECKALSAACPTVIADPAGDVELGDDTTTQ